ncbi:MAG: hypothetical protein R6U65_08055 [Perlabentimonas sp.]
MKSHNYKWFVVPLMLLSIVLGGCEKEDFTLPVDFKLSFTIKNEPILGGSITIDEISLQLNSIDIRGYREQGDDVFLTRNFDNGKDFTLRPTSTNIAEDLDIPQGTYNPLSLSFDFQPDSDEIDIIEDILDWFEDIEEDDGLEDLQEDLGDIVEEYLEDINPCILIQGKFTHEQKNKRIVIVVNDPLTFQIQGNNMYGSAEVVLDRNIVNTGKLQLNPSYWFSVITPAMLNNALVGTLDDEEFIFLSKYINSEIYTAIFNRMEESTTLTINE